MKKTLLLTTLILLTILMACHKDQPEINNTPTDPCSFAKEVSADFDILEISGQTGSIFEKTTPTDTIFKNKSVRFIAKDSTATYTWYIGNEVLTEREVVRHFDQSLSGQDITIALVVKKAPNLICLPNDDGYDSITKIMHVSQFPIDNNPILDLGGIVGTYRMKSAHLPDSFDISFDASYNIYHTKTFNITNFDGYGTNCIEQAKLNGRNYKQVWTNDGTTTSQCDHLKGYIHNKLNGEVEMKFTTGEWITGVGEKIYKWDYLGRKLN